MRNNNVARATTPPLDVYPLLVFVRLAFFSSTRPIHGHLHTTFLQLLIMKRIAREYSAKNRASRWQAAEETKETKVLLLVSHSLAVLSRGTAK